MSIRLSVFWSTITNVAFLYPAVCSYIQNPQSWPLSLALVGLMLGSGLFHFHHDIKYAIYDWVAMYWVFWSYSAYYLVLRTQNLLWWLLALGATLLFWWLYLLAQKVPARRLLLQTIYLALAALVTAILAGQTLPQSVFWQSVALFVLAFTFRQLGDWVWPSHEDFLHGLWHVVAAIGFVWLIPS